MCGLSLAWVTSENSTMLLESDILRLFFTGPYLVSSPLCSVSGVDCPSVLSRQLLLFASLLSSRNSSLGSSHQLLLSCHQLFSLLSSHQLLLSCHQLFSLLSSHQLPLSGPATNSLSRPLTTSGYGEIFFVQESFVWFRAKTDSSALAAYPHSATLNWTTRSSPIRWWQRCQCCSSPTRRWLSRSRGPYGFKSAFVGQCLLASKPKEN